jgi:hypothetical protein
VEGEVDVRVDEAREESGIAEIDDFSALWMGDGGAGLSDAIAFYENLGGRDSAASVDFEEAFGVEFE